MLDNNGYFRKLNEGEQQRFAYRVQTFIDSKSFSGRDGFVVTKEVAISIAASAVQLTFGLDTWDLSYFSAILLYPTDYQNPVTKNFHKGETNLGGFMCFAWDHFLAGNKDPDDKINLGLHEFAHALRFNGVKGNSTDYFFDNYFPRWVACAVKEFSRMRNNKPSIFRKYGSVNINEFFSVSVETFFETPKQFEEYFPELYYHTAILLNQTFSENGTPQLNCREQLLQKTHFRLSKAYPEPFRYALKPSGKLIMLIVFALAGTIALQNGGYLYPPPYICYAVAAICWLFIEKNYTRISFSETDFKLQKGFFLLKGYKKAQLPISHLISITGNTEFEQEGKLQPVEANVVYYFDTDFYEEELDCNFNQPEFDMLCDELKKNSVHVYIKE